MEMRPNFENPRKIFQNPAQIFKRAKFLKTCQNLSANGLLSSENDQKANNFFLDQKKSIIERQWARPLREKWNETVSNSL